MSITFSDHKIAGYGAYGRVYTGNYNGVRYATKRRYIVDSNKVPPGCVHVCEVDVMCRIKHPNILHALTMQRHNPIPDSFRTDKVNPRGDDIGTTFRADLVYLISDAADGDLSIFSISDSNSIPEYDHDGNNARDELKRLMWQILSGIAYLHAQGYIHRDIKPSNILFFDTEVSVGNEKRYQRNIKLCDFDMCVPDIPLLETSKAMTPEYTPPEVLTQGANVMYTPKVDIWGAGHVLYHLITGDSIIKRGHRQGYELDNYILAYEKMFFPNGSSIEIPDYLNGPIDTLMRSELEDLTVDMSINDDEVNDLLMHMLDCNPETRWTAIQCMQHSFFSGMEIPRDLIPPSPNRYGDILVDDYILDKHYITEDMAQVFDSQIKNLSDTEIPGFFLGIDILMRVCSKKYKGNARNLAICCFNLGMKFYNKESATFMQIDTEDAKRIEYNIIANHLSGKIYRDNIYNHIMREHMRVYTYIMAQDILPNKLSTLIHAVKQVLDP